MDAIYFNLCPICKQDLKTQEVENRICFTNNLQLSHNKLEEEFNNFLNFFQKIFDKPREIQKMWAKRILAGESFAAVAPTGVGKTAFGLSIALHLAQKGSHSYIILPTTLLVTQSISNIKEYAYKAGLNIVINDVSLGDGKSELIRVAVYHSKLNKQEKEAFFQTLDSSRIVITTSQFLSKNFEYIKDKKFNFIFVDDVDAILKASKNVDKILHLLGFRYKNGKWEGEPSGCLVVSTATAKKGKKAELFRTLLKFDIGSSRFAIRNIEDIVINRKDIDVLKRILREMRTGGLIYTPTVEEAKNLQGALCAEFKIGIATADSKTDFQRFEQGEVDYLIGTAAFYGTLVRGLDLPEKIRFAVFYGLPVFRIKVEDIHNASEKLISILAYLFQEQEEIKKFLPLGKLTPQKLKIIREAIIKILNSGREISNKDVVFRQGEIVFPDILTYIQASGRTSRFHSGGITKGASFILEEDKEVVHAFIKRASFYELEVREKSLDEIDFSTLNQEIDRTRKEYKKFSEDIIKPALFIVESPTKARSISRFFGKPSIRVINNIPAYEVATSNYILTITACLGHITDLTTERGFHGVEVGEKFIPIYASLKRCRECGYQFTAELLNCPKCNSQDLDDSKNRIDALRKLAQQSGLVIVGTDPDSEGEKIAWDIRNLLSGFADIKRAEFHEVTRKAITNALNNLRDMDTNLVKAQIVRRIEDRWIGFTLSEKLWQRFGDKNLSAGRAQTPVLGWIIQRAEENKSKKKIAIIKEWQLELDAEKEELEIEIELLSEERKEVSPLPPYTTDTLLRDANNLLKFDVRKCMTLAQDLFERGLITYHRTNSTRVSDQGMRIAKTYLGEDFSPREWFAQGAHECIRPTRPVDRYTLLRLIYEGMILDGLSSQHLALYDLIFRRFMASQCKNFNVLEARYKIKYDGKEVTEERVLNAEGKAFTLYKNYRLKPSLPTGKFEIKAQIREVPKVPLYTQSEIVQEMKERGIGRPSTYATIIEKLFLRKYIVEKNTKILPTSRGISIYKYLVQNYYNFVSEERTRILEEKMDQIEKNELDYLDALTELYEEINSIK